MNKKNISPKEKETAEEKKNKPRENRGKTPQLLRGFKDIMPEEQPYWEWIRKSIDELAVKYSFQRIDTPILESTSLFKRTIGELTDVVQKEMFSFETPGEDHVSLRPEATASVARAYIEHGLMNQPQPLKLFYVGPMFRYDRPQAGRLRQFHQFGFEILGEGSPSADALMIHITIQFFKKLGLSVNVHINSIGCLACRGEYKKKLQNYYRGKRSQLCKDCQVRLQKNPLRLLDCKEESCVPLKEDAPQGVDSLCQECQDHFMKVLEHLDELTVPYVLDSTLVRGLDYYNRTAFEFFLDDETSEHKSLALGGGGRYDYLMEQLSGRPTPAVGVAPGIERVIMALKHKELLPPKNGGHEILLAHIGANAKMKALKLFDMLHEQGFHIVENLVKDSLKAQLEMADKLGCRFVLILGQKEVLDGTILIRDMEAGIQESVDVKKIVSELHKRLPGKK